MVKDVDGAKKAESLAVQLSADCTKKDHLIAKLQKEADENHQFLADACDEIEEKSDEIFEAYRSSLATFGEEPEPLVKGSRIEVSGLLDWIPKEFSVPGNILTLTSDNSAVVACKNAFALLEHEGCQDLQKLTAHEYRLPEPSEMEASIANVQTVKRAFLRRF